MLPGRGAGIEHEQERNVEHRTSNLEPEEGKGERLRGAPPRAPGSGGVTSGATTTCLGGFSGSIFRRRAERSRVADSTSGRAR